MEIEEEQEKVVPPQNVVEPEAKEGDQQQAATRHELDAIQATVEEQRLLIIRSERRMITAFTNFFFRYRPKKKGLKPGESQAAFEAFLWSLSPVGGGGGGTGLLTIILTILTLHLTCESNDLSDKSNHLSERSNQLIDRQIAIEDAARRATISAELTAILDQINDYQIDHPGSRTLPSTIISRISSATYFMSPYDQPKSIAPDFPGKCSPERGQLLVVLASLNLSDYRSIMEKSNFSYAVIYQTTISSFDTKGKSVLKNCVFEHAYFLEDTMPRTDFSAGWMLNTQFETSYFANSVLDSVQISQSEFSRSNFDISNFRGAILQRVSFKNSTSCKGCDFNGAKLIDISIDSLSSFKGSNFTRALIINVRPTSHLAFEEANFHGAFVDEQFFNSVLVPLNIPKEDVHIIPIEALD
jgi:uncharacterized protein YjbI with pentapeptide repeats